MGLIISRFRRKKTTTEKLECLEKKISRLEQVTQDTELKRRRVVGSIMVYSVGLYVLFAILYYYLYIGRTQYWLHSALYASPLFVLPILVVLLRSGISRYYSWMLSQKSVELNLLKAEKKKILEDVMDTETYKVAKEILDKYGNPEENHKALKQFVPTTNVPGKSPSTPPPATPGQLRQRQLALQNSLSSPTPTNNNMLVPLMSTPTPMYKGPRLRSDQLPRPLLDKNRTALDKVVDYLLKDGPNHRMALICTDCCSHNGMAMVEEFDYVSYICAYCGKLNPARKQRPAAPLLSPVRALPPIKMRHLSGTSGSDDNSSVNSSQSDSDEERQVSEPVESEVNESMSIIDDTSKSLEEKKED